MANIRRGDAPDTFGATPIDDLVHNDGGSYGLGVNDGPGTIAGIGNELNNALHYTTNAVFRPGLASDDSFGGSSGDDSLNGSTFTFLFAEGTDGDGPTVDYLSEGPTEAGGKESDNANDAIAPEMNLILSGSGESSTAISTAAFNPAENTPYVLSTDQAVANDDLASALPTYTLHQIGDYIKEGFWDWFGSTYYRSFNMGSSGTGANNSTLYYNYSGFSGISGAGTDTNGISAARQALVDKALDYLGEITGINFVQTTSQDDWVDLFYRDNDSGAYSNSTLFGSGSGATNHRYIDYSWVNVESGWSGGTSDINDYTYQTIIHETLHALGLGHSGAYNGTAHYVTDTTDYYYGDNSNVYLNDSWQQATMSYIDQDENTTVNANYNYVITLMAGDFEALRDYYGSSAAFNGNTIYGFGTNISSSTNYVMANLATYADETAFCIIDSDGTDTVNFSGYSANQLIDLTVASASSTIGTISNIGGQTGNMALGVGTIIENAIGGSGADTIRGNDYYNILTGNNGNDTISGYGGNDTLNGGAGNDYMYGGTGSDIYYVDSSSDYIYEAASAGSDTVHASASYTTPSNVEFLYLHDTATNGFGNSEDNRIYGNTLVNNNLYGYAGNDSLYGYNGNDYLSGGTGDDYISGGNGNDSLYGSDGNDTLTGGAGNDYMSGGAGNDTYSVDSASDIVNEAASAGTDRVNAYLSYTLTANVENLYLIGATANGYGNALDNLIIGNSYANYLYGNAGNDSLYGYDGNDTLNGSTGNDYMSGGAGNDTYYVDSASDTVYEAASAGTDRVNAYLSYSLTANVEYLYLYDTATNGFGNTLDNLIVGNSNANYLYGNAGNDSLYGYDGNDTLNGSTGNDYMSGGAGNDTYYVDSASDTVYEAASAGTDRVNAYLSYSLTANVENLYLYDTATNGFGNTLDNLIVGNGNANYLYGYDGNDALYGYDGNDTLNGGAGNDYMSGGAGNDTYYVDSASDTVYEAASAGTDRVNAYASHTLNSNVEYLYLYGTATNGFGNTLDNLIVGNGNANYLYGYDGNDALYGYDGNDTLNGAAGNDYMSGGAGNDTYYIDSASDTAYEAASAGTDRVNAYLSYTLTANVENLYLYGTATNGFGNNLDNLIVGNGNANYLYGYDGNDALYGYDGNDTLNGAAGNDYMSGGAGNDTYYVNSASDTVYEAASAGTDRVNTYLSYTLTANVEYLYLYDTATNGFGNNVDNLIYGNSNANYLYGYDGNDALYGSDGNDTLNGAAGNDYMSGGAGNDTFYVDSAGDTVYEAASAGTDRVNAYASHTLTSNVEYLYLYDTATDGYGNTLDNLIYGNSNANNLYGNDGNDALYGSDGDDTLNGETGNDYMNGGAGNDTYYVDSASDTVYEAASAGTDRVNAYASYTLASNVESLYLYDTAANGYGNILDNVIVGNSNANYLYGNAGNDSLSGAAGNDTLNGGTGLDSFVFSESGSGNSDTIVDFSNADDTIMLKDILDSVTDSSILGLSFTGDVLNVDLYFEGAGYTGKGATDHGGIYNDTATGQIWYNSTDSTADDSVLICTVGSSIAASLDNTDFMYSA